MGSRRKRGEEARESVRAGTLGHRFTRLPLFYDPAKCRPPPPPHCPAPTPTIGRQGQAATRLDSNRSAVVFEKLDSSPFLEKLTSSVRQYQGRGAVHGGGGAPTRASKHPVAPAWTVNLPVGRVRSVDTERRESFWMRGIRGCRGGYSSRYRGKRVQGGLCWVTRRCLGRVLLRHNWAEAAEVSTRR